MNSRHAVRPIVIGEGVEDSLAWVSILKKQFSEMIQTDRRFHCLYFGCGVWLTIFLSVCGDRVDFFHSCSRFFHSCSRFFHSCSRRQLKGQSDFLYANVTPVKSLMIVFKGEARAWRPSLDKRQYGHPESDVLSGIRDDPKAVSRHSSCFASIQLTRELPKRSQQD
jgi:hypothetical protein